MWFGFFLDFPIHWILDLMPYECAQMQCTKQLKYQCFFFLCFDMLNSECKLSNNISSFHFIRWAPVIVLCIIIIVIIFIGVSNVKMCICRKKQVPVREIERERQRVNPNNNKKSNSHENWFVFDGEKLPNPRYQLDSIFFLCKWRTETKTVNEIAIINYDHTVSFFVWRRRHRRRRCYCCHHRQCNVHYWIGAVQKDQQIGLKTKAKQIKNTLDFDVFERINFTR